MRPSAKALAAWVAALALIGTAEALFACASGNESLASKKAKARPRNTANARCEGTRPMGSL